MVFVVINGKRERIDNFCGSETPLQLMSNGPSLRVEFKSIATSTGTSRGFKALYQFVTRKSIHEVYTLTLFFPNVFFPLIVLFFNRFWDLYRSPGWKKRRSVYQNMNSISFYQSFLFAPAFLWVNKSFHRSSAIRRKDVLDCSCCDPTNEQITNCWKRKGKFDDRNRDSIPK